jgi:hypothetical protein
MNASRTQHAVRADRSPRKWAAMAAAAGFLTIAAFQVALALGAPLGRAAWGGTYVQLPVGLRIASAFAVAVWVLAALVVLRRVGYRVPLVTSSVSRWGTGILVGASVLGALMNFASPSSWERFLWGPVGVMLAVLSLVVARGGDPITDGRLPVNSTRSRLMGMETRLPDRRTLGPSEGST